MVGSTDVFSRFLEIADRLQLDDQTLAVTSGLALHTIRFFRATKRPPKRPRAVAKVEAFVARNSAARSREDLKLCA
jgi:hypothetical protein